VARPSIGIQDASLRPATSPQSSIELIETGLGQLVALREQLEKIFRTVQPVKSNFQTYGHDIRNLLILAATEVEAYWKGILTANGVPSGSTNEYVKLLPAMKLNEYAVQLPHYPWLPVKPFKGWDAARPTKSLPWYDAYNAVKHDREADFARGTLLHAIEAVCACAILTAAQFGGTALERRREVNAFFDFVEQPKWDLSEWYLRPKPGEPHKAIMYPF
jgi:hypothetical protein